MNIIVLGQQGCGKGTQSEKLASKYGLDHFDTGSFLRQVSKLDTPLGREVNEIIMVKKELVPSRILKEILHIRLASLSGGQGIVFDGVPRNLEQTAYFEEALLDFGRRADRVFFINIGEKESLKRISKRWICQKCKSLLIMGIDVKNEKSLCSKCGGEIMQREDDTVAGIKKRLKIFNEETLPVIAHFKEQGILTRIDGERGAEDVFMDLMEKMKIY